MRARLFTLLLTLLLGSSPIATVVCAMQCSDAAAKPSCHNANGSAAAAALREAQHPCDHDHASGNPAALTNSATRSLGGTLIVASLPTAEHFAGSDGRLIAAYTHGPPGPSLLTPSLRATILRI